MTELLLGCGSSRAKRLAWQGRPTQWESLVTLDFAPEHKPDIVWDIAKLPLPIEDDSLDEIHAYEVLEHVGRQGDWRFFFDQFADFWRMLKPDGLLLATCPDWRSPWAWGDPGHTRVICEESLYFLMQPNYRQVGSTPMTDYRSHYKADFELLQTDVRGDTLAFVLQAIKPPRIDA